MAKESGWVTINGVHVFIDNSGKISKGPAKFIGSTVNDLPSSGKSAADRKAELKAKYGDNKSGDKTKSSSDSNADPRSEETMGSFLKRVYGIGNRPNRPTRGASGTAKSESAPKKTPETREATATDILGVNGSDPNGVYALEKMRDDITSKALRTGKISKADQKKLDLIDQELDDSPWQEFRTFTGVGGGPDSGRPIGDARPSPTPGEKVGDYLKRTGSTFGSSSRTRGRGAASPESSEGFITRTNKTGVTHGDISKVVNTSGTVSMKDLPDLKSLPKGAAKLIVQDNSSQLKQPKFAIQVGDTVMRATPKVAASLFPDEVKNLTSTMGNLASKYGVTGNATFDNATATTKKKIK